MTDHPIIFSGPMVLALLAGRKTMTRRLAWKTEPCPQSACPFEPRRNHAYPDKTCESCPRHHKSGAGEPSPWQRVQPGDRLWVRESLKNSQAGWTYAAEGRLIEMSPRDPRVTSMISWAHHKEGDNALSIHMPRWASRLTLVVTATKIERLQEISNEDAIAEGVFDTGRRDGAPYAHFTVPGFDLTTEHSPQPVFFQLWERLHGEGAVAANPEVIPLSFTVHKQNIDAIAEAA